MVRLWILVWPTHPTSISCPRLPYFLHHHQHQRLSTISSSQGSSTALLPGSTAEMPCRADFRNLYGNFIWPFHWCVFWHGHPTTIFGVAPPLEIPNVWCGVFLSC